uniref:Uncharacterized protein n=1 Tax=Panagrellus redivivus TaxID=6233 RepID=A0A7E4W0M1_PANRE
MAAGHRHWQQNTVRRADHPSAATSPPSAATPTVPSDTHRPQRHPSSPATSPVPSDITSPERHLQSAAASPVRSVFRLAPSAIPGGESLLAMKHRPRTHIPIQPSYHLLRLYHADISYYITPTAPQSPSTALTFHPLHRLPCPVAPEGPSLPSKCVFSINRPSTEHHRSRQLNRTIVTT